MQTSLSPRAARVALIAVVGLYFAGCEPNDSSLNTAPTSLPQLAVVSAPEAGSTTLGGPLADLTADELTRFAAGQEEFEDVEDVDEGLGPVFNEASCAICHADPVGGTNGRAETRFGRKANGVFDPLASLGGSLIQDHAIGAVETSTGEFIYVPESVPEEANVRSTRITTPLFGLGLVDAVPDETFLELARSEANRTGGVAHLVTEIATGLTRVGRFGWKSQVPTLHQFSGDAYLNEMGVTNPEFPNESCPQGNCAALVNNPMSDLNDDGTGVVLFADFMTLLGPPPQGDSTPQTLAGRDVFTKIGCVDCHTPTLTTGSSPTAALDHKSFHPYSDFLLHDMGSLGDGIVQGQAKGSQFRTAPLWGLHSRATYLHDGRASTLENAILAHDGQGKVASNRYWALPPADEEALLAFLSTL